MSCTEEKFQREETHPVSLGGSECNSVAAAAAEATTTTTWDGEPLVYSDEELAAMKEVKAKLLEENGIESFCDVFLVVATINCKLNVTQTVTKVIKLSELMSKLGCSDGIDENIFKPNAVHELKSYAPAGRDRNGCLIQWIRGGSKVKHEEERNHVHACLMQYMAIHSDPRTLHHGLSMVFDLTGRDDMAKQSKVGNEKLFQSFYQALPTRPQTIQIIGTSFITRTFINASIKLASIFIKQKILTRIHFSTFDEVKKLFPEDSIPKYLGGNGGGISDNYEEWIRDRLESLPRP